MTGVTMLGGQEKNDDISELVVCVADGGHIRIREWCARISSSLSIENVDARMSLSIQNVDGEAGLEGLTQRQRTYFGLSVGALYS